MSNQDQKRAASTGITDAWYQSALWLYLLAPLSLIYAIVITIRSVCYRMGLIPSYRSRLPVVVVGNITVGGTGKSPLVAHLIKSFQAKGFHPGIISRGYGADISSNECREVLSSSSPADVGDEPLMLKQLLGCPIFVSPNRRLSVQALEATGCNVVISDDGLQHYALQRDVEICVLDGQRGLGNGHLLPMGPMREWRSRLNSIDYKVINGVNKISGTPQWNDSIRMDLVPGKLSPLLASKGSECNADQVDLSDFKGKRVNAVAAIGNPERFFAELERSGLQLNRYAFEDHHAYAAEDFSFTEELPIIMTEKDAVKCRALGLSNAWYMPVEAQLDHNLVDSIIEKNIEGIPRG